MKKLLLTISLLLLIGFGVAQDTSQVEACDYSEYDHLQEKVNTILSQYDHLWDDENIRVQLEGFLIQETKKIKSKFIQTHIGCMSGEDDCKITFTPSVPVTASRGSYFGSDYSHTSFDDYISGSFNNPLLLHDYLCYFIDDQDIKKKILLDSILHYIQDENDEEYITTQLESLIDREIYSRIVYGSSAFEATTFDACGMVSSYSNNDWYVGFTDLLSMQTKISVVDYALGAIESNATYDAIESSFPYHLVANVRDRIDNMGYQSDTILWDTDYGLHPFDEIEGCLSSSDSLFVFNYRGGVATYDIDLGILYVPYSGLTAILSKHYYGAYDLPKHIKFGKNVGDYIEFYFEPINNSTLSGSQIIGKYYYTNNVVYIEKICHFHGVDTNKACQIQNQRFLYNE